MRRALVGALLVGCGPGVASPSDATDTTASSASITDSETGSDASMSTTSTTAPDPGDTTAPDADGGSIFIAPDAGTGGGPCDLWAQDCPRGEKCMPYANDGGGAFNATHCTPIDDDPRAPGEPCTVVGSPVSGIDDCERGAMCWNLDPETNTGECVAMCQGTELSPTCANPCEFCTISAEGTLNLCVRACDPVAQDCGPGEACYPVGDTFDCVADVSGDAGAIGEPCEFINVCDAGLFCAMDGSVPGCEGTGCCAPFCDAAGPDPCAALLPGTVCTPWFEAGMEPACGSLAIVGACRPPA